MSPPAGRRIVITLTPKVDDALELHIIYGVDQLLQVTARTSVVLLVLRSLLSQMWPDKGSTDFQ